MVGAGWDSNPPKGGEAAISEDWYVLTIQYKNNIDCTELSWHFQKTGKVFRNTQVKEGLSKKAYFWMSWNDTKNTSAKKKRIFEEFCLPKFHSSPLKSYRNPLGKACLPTTILRGELLNFGGTLEDKRLEPTAITHEKKGKENDRSNQTSRECMFHVNLQWCIDLSVSENGGTPESSILIGFSIINHPFWGTPIFGNTHLVGRKTTFFSNFEKVHLQVCGALDNDSRRGCFTNQLSNGKKNSPHFCTSKY